MNDIVINKVVKLMYTAHVEEAGPDTLPAIVVHGQFIIEV